MKITYTGNNAQEIEMGIMKLNPNNRITYLDEKMVFILLYPPNKTVDAALKSGAIEDQHSIIMQKIMKGQTREV